MIIRHFYTFHKLQLYIYRWKRMACIWAFLIKDNLLVRDNIAEPLFLVICVHPFYWIISFKIFIFSSPFHRQFVDQFSKTRGLLLALKETELHSPFSAFSSRFL